MKTFGIIGGLGTLSGGDVFFKLLKSRAVLGNQQDFHFLFEQFPYQQINNRLANEADVLSRKFYAYTICKSFEEKRVDCVLLPCFASHTFIDQLQAQLTVPILNLLEAVTRHLSKTLASGTKIGLIASDYVKQSGLLNHYLADYELVFPRSQAQIMEAIYGTHGIKRGYLDAEAFDCINQVCTELQQEGCQVIFPGVTELSLLVEPLGRRGIPLVDVNQIYVDYALTKRLFGNRPEFKLGILGGVGPAATVDFMNKVIQSTPARKDQEHIKMVVEQNPQIPDRTANLLFNEPDPILAMLATCKQLEAEGARAIAIPCNTAHAFVDRIQPHLRIPIINMPDVTIEHIIEQYGNEIAVGLLATSGTLASRVYHDAAARQGLALLIPHADVQPWVMESIYGPKGVKAGFSTGQCVDDVTRAIYHLVDQGAQLLILGCTELPLMFPDRQSVWVEDNEVPLIDPTLILAQKCVSMAATY